MNKSIETDWRDLEWHIPAEEGSYNIPRDEEEKPSTLSKLEGLSQMNYFSFKRPHTQTTPIDLKLGKTERKIATEPIMERPQASQSPSLLSQA